MLVHGLYLSVRAYHFVLKFLHAIFRLAKVLQYIPEIVVGKYKILDVLEKASSYPFGQAKTPPLAGESFLFIPIMETMKPILRNYRIDEDYFRIREFLREVSLYNNRHDFAWSLLRWNYWRWHANENIFHLSWKM